MAHEGSMMAELKELCENLEREIRKVNKSFENNSSPLTPQDLDYLDKLMGITSHATKSLWYKTQIQMVEEYGPVGDSHRNASTMHRFGTSDNDPYGRNQDRDGRGRYMDNETSHMMREIMVDTKDERTRDRLRQLLDRM